MDDKKNIIINTDNEPAAADRIIEDSFAESISAAAVAHAESVINPSAEDGIIPESPQPDGAGSAPEPHIEAETAETAPAKAKPRKKNAAAVTHGEEAGEAEARQETAAAVTAEEEAAAAVTPEETAGTEAGAEREAGAEADSGDKSETEKKVEILRETAAAEEKAEADRIKAEKRAAAAAKAKAARAAKASQEAAKAALAGEGEKHAPVKPRKATAAEKGKAIEHEVEDILASEGTVTVKGAKHAHKPKKRIVAATEAHKAKDVTDKTPAERMKDKAAKEADPRSIAAKQEKLKASPVGKKKVNEANSGLKLLYQPVFEPAKNLLIGFECLLRIYDIELGVLTPGMFLEVAQKDIKLIKRLEDWSIEEVLRSSKKLRDQNLQILSVNVSTKHFFDSDFVETTSRLIERAEMRPQNIYFEMREEVLSGPYVEVVNKFAALQALGIKIAIDDFGTSYFSGDKKPDFKLDMVKLPFALVKQFMNDRRAKSLIRIILAYAKQKKIDVIALGVETKAQEEALLKMGVRKMQGYLYSKPLTTQRMSIKKR